MKDYLSEARQHIREKYGEQFSVLEKSIVDLDRFYCFTFQSNEFLKTGNFSTMAVGQGYTIINKADNRFFNFGSGYSLDESLKVLDENLQTEAGIRKYKSQFILGTRYDLQINSIKKRQTLIEILQGHQVTYVIPEVVGDSIFRIAKAYDSKKLEKRLLELPVVFHGVSESLMLINELTTSACCDLD